MARAHLWFHPSRWITASLAVLAFALFIPSLSIQAQEPELKAIDDAVQARIDDFYTRWLKQTPALPQDVTRASAAPPAPIPMPEALKAGLHVRADFETMLKEADEARLLQALQLLYFINDTASVQRLADYINRKGLAKARAGNYLLLARYYQARQDWTGVTAALNQVEPSQLSSEDRSYVALLRGYALQAQKKHRKAADIYQTIHQDSPYFAYARLNEGTAYLRQGWWSEAFDEFGQAIATLDKSDELRDRLLVTLGFAQIHHEFYRNARETLRQVSLDSEHTGKALLGLGLAAAHQQDLRAALHLFTRLTTRSPVDANVDEAHLLVPHVYDELAEREQAAAAYRRAIDFYQQRLHQLAAAQRKLTNAEGGLQLALEELSPHAEALYGSAHPVPEYMTRNYNLLLALRQQAREAGVAVSVDDLLAEMEQALRLRIEQTLAQRKTALESYLSQAKYGLATLYDTP